jgi:hypothetical protein
MTYQQTLHDFDSTYHFVDGAIHLDIQYWRLVVLGWRVCFNE